MSSDDVVVLRKRAPRAADLKKDSAVNKALRDGIEVEKQQKYNAGTNKQHVSTKNSARLDRESEELRHKTLSLDVGKLIQQARQAKTLSQKELATRINEKPQVIQEYEQGKAIPNNIILGKIEKVVGVKLRGKDRGQPLFGGAKK